MDDVNLASQDLTEVPESILESKITTLNLDFNDITLLPVSLCEKLSNLSILSVNGNFLETLPSSIDLLTELTELYVKENSLRFLPDSIVKLKNLKKFHITGNFIEAIPENIHLMECLTEFLADENAIKCLPSSFGKLSNLSYLSLSCNTIEILPDNFGYLQKLNKLDLSSNNLQNLPCSFENLPTLEIMDFTNNNLKFLSSSFLSVKCVEKIMLSKNMLQSIPLWFSDLEAIKEIYLADNKLQGDAFPKNFGIKCSTLEKMDLSGNNISSLPESFGRLRNLVFLDLGSSFPEPERNPHIGNGNELFNLPSTFCDLINLTKLELDENHIEELPKNFGQLINLIYLDLSHNILKCLPESFGQLQNLQVCMLGINSLSHLPNSFGQLTSLQDLKLDNNRLEVLPESFENLTALVSLDLFGNCLKEIPRGLYKMKNLKHLDIGKNDFGIPIDNIPQLVQVPTYAVQSLDINDCKEKDEEMVEKEILCNAMMSASSLWRKHGQSTGRKESFHDSKSITSRVASKSENDSTRTLPLTEHFCESLANTPSEYWDDDLSSFASENNVSCEDSLDVYDDSYFSEDCQQDCDFPNNFSKVFAQPVNNFPSINMHFIPSDLHVKRIEIPISTSCNEEGQFDDAEF